MKTIEYNEIQNELKSFINYYEKSTIETIKWDEYRQLEKIYKNNYLVEELKARAGYLHKWMHNIGEEVYTSFKSFNYFLVDSFNEVDIYNRNNFDTSYSMTFTQAMFDKLCVDYFEYQVKRTIEDLTERTITSNSTCKISNLVFEWRLECNQNLLSIFKKLIE